MKKILILMIFFVLINQISLFPQDNSSNNERTINWIHSKNLDNTVDPVISPIIKDNIINKLTNEFNEPLWVNNRFNNIFNEKEKYYYFQNNTASSYDNSNDFICLQNVLIYGDFSCHVAAKSWSDWWNAKNFAITAYVGLYLNKTNSSDDFSNRVEQKFDWNLESNHIADWQGHILQNSIDIYSASNGNPIIYNSLFKYCPGDKGAYFGYSYWDSGWSNSGNISWTEGGWKTQYQSFTLYYAQSPLPKIDHPTKYFTNDINKPAPHNCLWTSPITITTDYRVKIFVIQFYKINSDGSYSLLDKTLVNKSNSIDTDGIYSISIPAYHITKEDKYAMELGIVDKFNKMYLFEPQYFNIVKPAIEIKKTEVSNNKTLYNEIPDVLFSSGINTNNDGINLKYTVNVTNLYDQNLSLGFSSGIQTDPTETTGLDETAHSQTYYLKPVINNLKNGDVRTFADSIAIKYGNNDAMSVSQPVTPIIIRHIPDSPGVSSGNISPKSLGLNQSAVDNEKRLWKDDDYRINSTSICENDESLTAKDFMTQNAELFDIPINLGDRVNLINLAVSQNDVTKNFYFKIGTDQSSVICYDDQGNPLTDFTTDADTSGKITAIHKKISYDKFFGSSALTTTSFPIGVFAKQFKIDAEGARFFTDNFYKNNLILTDSDIDNLISSMSMTDIAAFFHDRKNPMPNDERGIAAGQTSPDDKSAKSPPYPSRVVYTNIQRDVSDGDQINFHIKPKFTGEISPDSSYSYRIIAIKESDYSGMNENGLLEDLYDTNGEPVTPENNSWTYDRSKRCYISDWITNSSSRPVYLGKDSYDGSDTIKFVEGTTTGESKIHFYTVIRFLDIDGTYKCTSAFRHTAICIDDSLSVIRDPADLFKDGPDAYIHEKVIFTKDVFIPENCSMTFGFGSFVNTTKTIKVLSNVALNNNIKIIAKGKLIITNTDGQRTSPKKVYFGPTGISTGSSMNSAAGFLTVNGMWGGIYIMDNGKLSVDGAIISGAYDGIILYNNGGNAVIKNCEIKYNEIGLQIYNSYPLVDGTLSIESNLLYGVKEDNAAQKLLWKFNDGILDSIKGNLIDYYDMDHDIVK